MPKWTHPMFFKIHEGCGGLVRWVEAVDRPGVGWTGECQGCDTEGIVTERIIPVCTRDHADLFDQLDDLGIRQRRDLTWVDGADWETNQERLANQVRALAEGQP